MAFYFTRDHEWISVNPTVDDVTATVGITDYAQAQLGDVVFVEVPPAGTTVEKGKEAAVVESVKAASDVYAPVSGEVIEANAALEADPSLVNSAPETDGWFFKVKLSDPGQLEGLMDADSYKVYLEGL
ncbi:MAG TPA: glycine cleavage system protein GcvH [Sphingomonas sp.]|jgi:glycine cleavage system H protein|uniref:glycine cleavage system protein GcvH n=1 Tax=Sphingomonas sp. TaxID=28214 RepID=UPI002ED93D68